MPFRRATDFGDSGGAFNVLDGENIVYWANIGIMEKEMETTIQGSGFRF